MPRAPKVYKYGGDLRANFVGMTRIAHEIFRGDWFITKSYASAYLPQVAAIIRGNASAEPTRDKDTPAEITKLYGTISADADAKYVVQIDPYWGGAGIESLPAGSVAVVPITGAIMKYDYCGDAGTKSIAMTLARLDAAPNIESIVLRIDSGGGTVSGTTELGNAIAAVEKPIAAFIDDLAASAAYWIAASCDLIYANNDNAEIGSIGVYTTVADWNAYYESEGLPVKDIYSSLSSEKNGEYREALAGNDEPMRARLDVLAANFINHVKASRPSIKSDAPFKGAMYFAPEAVQIGLIDGIGSELDLIASLQALTPNPNDMTIQNFPNLSKARKADVLNEDAIAAINTELSAQNVPGFLIAASEDVPNAEALEVLIDAASSAEQKAADLTAQLAQAMERESTAAARIQTIAAALGLEDGAASDIEAAAKAAAEKATKYDAKVAGSGAQGTSTAAVDSADPAAYNEDEFEHNKIADAAGFGAPLT